MGGGSIQAKQYPLEYFCASALSATINYPLWRASAIGQSGFVVSAAANTSTTAAGTSSSSCILGLASTARRIQWLAPYRHALLPPYKGAVATVLGMTWARAAIFWGSDAGRDWLLSNNLCGNQVATVLPPLTVSTLVQFVNMPLVRATITIQNPESNVPSVWKSMRLIYQQHGLRGLWHGTSAGVLKTVPKYCTAVIVKDFMEDRLPPVQDSSDRQQVLTRSALKSAAAGVAGATLTNPLDVIRNEMFKTNLGLVETVRHLRRSTGWNFLARGLVKNMIAVAIPVSCTIFFTDALIQFSSQNNKRRSTRTRQLSAEQQHS